MDIERVRKELQASALRDFPNPERIGCPDPAALEDMSRRKTGITQDQLHHITHCSPCLQTFLSIRDEIRKKRAVRIRIAAVACAAAIVVGAIIYAVGDHLKSPTQVAVLATPATLDLRPLSQYRSADSGRTTEAKPALILPRRNLRLTLYFPVGADEGQYTMQLLDGQLHTLLKQYVTATLQNHVVTASTDIDLSSFSPDTDTLAIQKTGEEWRTYPVVLR
jgi:hypothetical protein